MNARGLVFAGCCILGLVTAEGAGSDTTPGRATDADVTATALPIAFEPNRGQSAAPVRFMARAAGYRLFMTDGEDVIVIGGFAAPRHGGPHAAPERLDEPPRAVSITLLGASRRQRIDGGEALPGVVNYLLGRDSAGWHVGIPTFRRVTRRDVWPGIDVAYHADADGRIENDFVAAPGADLGSIQLAFQGSDGVTVDRNGNLIIAVGRRILTLLKPDIYQSFAGRKVPVDGRYVVDAGNPAAGPCAHFVVAPFDRGRSLVIDPKLSVVYSTDLRGSGLDDAAAIAVAAGRNAFIAGRTRSADFPATNGPLKESEEGFVVRLAEDGKTVVYTTFIGGKKHSDQTEITAIDSRDDAEPYIAGVTDAQDFPTTPHVFQPDAPGNGGHPFVAKLRSNGQALAFATYLGSSGGHKCQNSDPGVDWPVGIKISPVNEVYIAGNTCSEKFPLSRPIQFADSVDYPAAFVTRLSGDGRHLITSTYLGGHGFTLASGIAINPNLVAVRAYVTGTTSARDFPVKNALQPQRHGYSDAFVTEFSGDGTSLIYSTYLGGDNGDEGRGIAVDDFEHAYVVGDFASTNFPISHSLPFATSISVPGVFVAKFAHDGSLLFCDAIGTFPGAPTANGIAVRNGAYVTGTVDGPGLSVTSALQDSSQGGRDAFVTKIDKDGGALEFSSYLGGSGDDQGEGIAVDGRGDAYVVGRTSSNSFPTGQPVHPGSVGDANGFVVKLHLGPSAVAEPPPQSN